MKNFEKQLSTPQNFDLFRLSKSKSVVDVCPNTIRTWANEGLNIYRCGKAIFVSKLETEAFIRARAAKGGVQ